MVWGKLVLVECWLLVMFGGWCWVLAGVFREARDGCGGFVVRRPRAEGVSDLGEQEYRSRDVGGARRGVCGGWDCMPSAFGPNRDTFARLAERSYTSLTGR